MKRMLARLLALALCLCLMTGALEALAEPAATGENAEPTAMAEQPAGEGAATSGAGAPSAADPEGAGDPAASPIAKPDTGADTPPEASPSASGQPEASPTAPSEPSPSASAEPEESPSASSEPSPSASAEPEESPVASSEPSSSPTALPEDEALLAAPLLLAAGAHTAQVGNSTYRYDLTADGTGAILTGYEGKETALTLPASLNGLPVVSIARDAFQGASMSALAISSSLTSIGEGAFAACPNLVSVTISAKVNSLGAGAFQNCPKLAAVNIASGLGEVGAGAFQNCAKLANVTLPMDTLTAIAADAFDGCPLARVNESVYRFSLASGEICIEGYLGTDGNLTLPDAMFGRDVTEVGAQAFRNSKTLETLGMGKNIASIGASAFENCDKLWGLTLNSGLTSIGAAAFRDCDQLKTLSIPSSVSTIGASAFEGLDALEEARLESGVAAIGAGAFKNCPKLKTLRVPDSVTAIHADAFDGCDFANLSVTLDGNLGTPYAFFSGRGAKIFYDEAITDDLFQLSDYSPTGSTAVISGYTGQVLDLTIPKEIYGYRIIAIGEDAFANNAYLTRVTIPGSISQISGGAFSGCPALEEVTLGSGVTTVGDGAFENCGVLKTVNLPMDTLATLGSEAFSGCDAIASFGGSREYVFSLSELAGGATVERYIGSSVAVELPDELCGRALVGVGSGAFRGTGITSVKLGAHVNRVGPGAFQGEKLLAEVAFNSRLLQIQDFAFEGCEALRSVALPESLLLIGERAFAGTALSSITIPRNVNSLAVSAISEAKITSIQVDSRNAHYVAMDEALFTRDTRELMRYFGTAPGYTLPSGVAAIRDGAFQGNKTLISVILADGLTAIGARAFKDMPLLAAVTIPDSVTQIADDAFEGFNPTRLKATVYTETGTPYQYCQAKGILTNLLKQVAPDSVELFDVAIGQYETVRLLPKLSPEGATTAYTWKSSNVGYVVVDDDGTIYGKKTGSVLITVETENGLEASCVVTVKKAPSKIYLSPASLLLGEGQEAELKASLPSGTAGGVTFTSDNPFVASVSADGHIEALNEGVAYITASTYNGKRAMCKVTVLQEPKTLTLPLSAGTLGIGQVYTLLPELDNGQGVGAVSFHSDNLAVAGVDQEGNITAKRLGFATITVSAYNAASGDPDLIKTFAIAVVRAPNSVSFALSSGSMAVGQKVLFPALLPAGTAAGLTYKSSKTSVATVDQSGLITARKAGTAYIYVTTHNGITARCKVTVKKAPSWVKLNASKGTLGKGNTYQLKASVNSGSYTSLTYTSSDPSVVSVTDSGLIRVMAESGSAVITVRTHNNKTSSCVITACPAPREVSVEEPLLTLGRGQSYQVYGHVLDALGNEMRGNTTHWSISSSDDEVVSVSSGGKLKAKRAGVAVITLKTYNGLAAHCLVTVKEAPSRVVLMYNGVVLNNKTGYMTVGEKLTIDAVLPEGSGGLYAFYTSNSRILRVDKETGELTAVRAGTATITVKTYNGKSAKVRIRVRND